MLKINVDENKEVSIKYGIRSIPTLVLFQNGKPVWRQSGVVQSKKLIEEVEKMV